MPRPSSPAHVPDPLRVRDIAEVWEVRRQAAIPAGQRGATDNLRDWAETMNARTKMLISELQVFDPYTWRPLAAVCQMKAKGMAIIDPAVLAVYRRHEAAFTAIEYPSLWDALEELSTHAITMCSNAKFMVNKLDRTNL